MMITRKKILTGIVFLCTALLFAAVPDTETLYKRFEKIFDDFNFANDLTCTLSLITEKPNEPKTAQQFKVFRRDKEDKTCLVQLAPEADKGAGYLQDKNNLWFYDPITHQFTHSSLKRNLGESNAKVSDVNGKTSFRETYRIISAEEAMLGKFPVYAVMLQSLQPDASYAQEKYFLRTDADLILKVESYGASGRHMRTALFPKYVKVQGATMPVQQIFINELKKGEKTTQVFSDFESGNIPDVVFTKAYLEKIN